MVRSKGPLLSIDLTQKSTEEENISNINEIYMGGRGLATKLAHDRLSFNVDPLGKNNRVFISSGPLQYSQMSFTGRMNATSVSPLSDGLLSSNAGGFVSRHFVDTGYSAIELKGKSEELMAIRVTDEGVEFETVPELEKAKVSEVTEYFENTHGLNEENIIAIGPAGENLVRYASLMTTEHRAFGRGGLGAVFGSKNLKAITFEGDSRPNVEIPSVQTEIHKDAAVSDHVMKEQGSVSATSYANEVDAFPTKYFQKRSFDGYENINGESVASKKHKKGTCSTCAFGCKLPTKDEDSGLETEGPEYETVMSFGGNCLVDDIVHIMKSNDLCDELGLDTISAGNAIAAYLMSNDDFGNKSLIHKLIKDIAYRKGEGDTLAEGIHRFHDDYGVEDWTVKGVSFPAHDGRALHGQGLSFATSNRGADHMYSTFFAFEYPFVEKDLAIKPKGLDEKPEKIVEQEAIRAVEDSAILCRYSREFVPLQPKRLEELLDKNYSEIVNIGEKIISLERHFNNQRGFDRSDDKLPYELPSFESALSSYYEAHGWKQNGTVPQSIVSDM